MDFLSANWVWLLLGPLGPLSRHEGFSGRRREPTRPRLAEREFERLAAASRVRERPSGATSRLLRIAFVCEPNALLASAAASPSAA